MNTLENNFLALVIDYRVSLSFIKKVLQNIHPAAFSKEVLQFGLFFCSIFNFSGSSIKLFASLIKLVGSSLKLISSLHHFSCLLDNITVIIYENNKFLRKNLRRKHLFHKVGKLLIGIGIAQRSKALHQLMIVPCMTSNIFLVETLPQTIPKPMIVA